MLHQTQLRQIEKSATLLVNEQSKTMEQAGSNVYKLGFGQCPFPPPHIVQQALCEHVDKHEYTPVQGIVELREQLSRFCATNRNLDFSADNIFIGPGSKALIYCLFACFKRANIFMPCPAWVSYAPQAQMLGHVVHKIPTSFEGRWRMNPNTIDLVLNTSSNGLPSILVMTYPGNPTGLTYTEEELKELSHIARKHNVIILADEIYGYMTHSGKVLSMAEYYPEGTIISTGLSKWAGAGGWRLGVMMLPEVIAETLKETFLGIASEIYSCAPTPVQYAAITAYSDVKEVKDYRSLVQKLLGAVGNACQQRLAEAGLDVHPPAGGFYLLVDFSPCKAALNKRGINTGAELCQKLLEDTGVALLPISAFGMHESYLATRLCYVNFDGAAMLEAAKKHDGEFDDAFVTKYAAQTIEGVEAICGWVKG